MAKKVNAEMAKRAKSLGINAKSEEELREELLKVLEKNGIDGMEEEETITLMEIAESFVEEPETTEDEDEVEEVEETEDDEADETDEEDLADEAEEEEADETDEVEEEEEEKPAKKSKKAVKPEKKEEPKKADKKAKKEEPKAEKKAVKKAETPKKEKVDFRENEENRKLFAKIMKEFPEKDFHYAWLATSGVTIKKIGKNSQRGVATIENCSRLADGTVICNMALIIIKKDNYSVLDGIDFDFTPSWTGSATFKKITLDEALEILTYKGVREFIEAKCQKIDKRLGDNRAKMEADIDKKASKKAVKKEEPKAEKSAKKAENKAEPEKPAKKTSKK